MPRRIVIADDDPPFLHLARAVLEEEGYQVAFYERGERAHQSIQRARPDLVILDLHIEEIAGGLQIAHWLRRTPELRHVPIMLCTADPDYLARHLIDPRAEGLVMLAKPFEIETLVAIVGDLIGPASE